MLKIIVQTVWLYLASHYANEYIGFSNPQISRILSTIHSIFAIIGASLYLWFSNEWLLVYIYTNSVSYCVYDMLNVINEKSPTMVVHHTIFASGMLIYGFNYPREICLFLLTEISTVFLNITWHFHKTNQTNTIQYKIVVGILLTSYFIFRIVGVSFILYRSYIVKCISCSLPIFILLLLNIGWFFKLSSIAIKQFWCTNN